jgi:ATP-dependent Clp protease ATP-binding subunit ClpA
LQQGIGLVVCEDALNQIAETGFNPVYGAVPLKRYVQQVLDTRLMLNTNGGIEIQVTPKKVHIRGAARSS